MNNISVELFSEDLSASVKFTESRFPGGELHVRVESVICEYECEYESKISNFMLNGMLYNQCINSVRFNLIYKNDLDLMRIALMKDALQEIIGYDVKYTLSMPYHPYARQDRVCTDGDAFSLRVAVNMIRSLNFDKIYVQDPHSNVLAGMYPAGMLEIQSQDIVLMNLIRWNLSKSENPKSLVLIAPDEGAFKKTEALLDKFHGFAFQDVSMIRCFKKRDPKTGKILSVECLDEIPNKSVTVVVTDDICDGGGTFIALIENIKHKFCKGSKFYLCVTHGIFSKGVDVLEDVGYAAVFAVNDMTKYEQPY